LKVQGKFNAEETRHQKKSERDQHNRKGLASLAVDGKATERGARTAPVPRPRRERKRPTHAELNGQAATFAPDLPRQRMVSPV